MKNTTTDIFDTLFSHGQSGLIGLQTPTMQLFIFKRNKTDIVL